MALLCGSEPAVRVEDLEVWFRTTREKRTSFKRRLRELPRRSRSTITVNAVRGISFEVPKGSVYGVIGKNGAGKSTLFRTIAGILAPNKGRVLLYGRVTPLLQLGVGFNAELTGRENILLGGLAHGLSVEDVREHIDEIITFADIGDAIDLPMRTYSSGMKGRLSFAVVAHLDPEIVLIDEALGGGDASFKHKCEERIAALCEGDTTVMIISHGLGVIKKMAQQALWLEDGEIRAEGEAPEIVEAYLADQEVEEDATSMEDL